MFDSPRFHSAVVAAFVLLKNRRIRYALAVSFLLIILPSYISIVRPPDDFPSGVPIEVPPGAPLEKIANIFESENLVRSGFWLKNLVVLFGSGRSAQAGEYLFEKPANVFSVAWALARGRFGFELARITVPEGTPMSAIPVLFDTRFTRFSSEGFLRAALGKEGYLFPDTYFFPVNVSSEAVVSAMLDNFDAKYARIEREEHTFGRSRSEIVIMASLLEEEARTTESRRIIAGILWKRFDMNMLLQVDAVFPFIIGKNTYQLTRDDLTYDSPYNTYRYRGLPPGPITNPGLDALTAAVMPIATSYLYYLSDREGNMHYAKTFEEHVRNKEQYLR